MYNDNQETIISQLPNKPYCSDNLDYGLKIRPKNKALDMLYLQINNPSIQTCLLFDIDRDNSFYDFEEAHLPVPHFTTQNPENGRCHMGYILKRGVCKTQNAKLEPLRYAAAVELEMGKSLKADQGFAGLITKNPFNPHWRPHWSNADLYELDYLADFITLENTNKETTKYESFGLGRNVNLFDDLRHYAYKNVLKFKDVSDFHHWMNEIEKQAINLNTYSNPTNLLPFNEIKATARSVGKWVWKNFSSEQFSKIQSERGKRNLGKTKTKKKAANLLAALRNELL
ncbi:MULTISPECIES: replication initiation protein [Bacteria]|uniref:Replicase family protein n=3 Tax=Gammaproteobacteria TaxID=1236 RepID=A0A0U3S8A8_PRORE|nr:MULTISPECIES: replication initiation protein [Gammaproteobacteria]ALV81729.1 Replicase family protein [Providencia rettgeri]ELR5224365.1 replication initiation protein [Providencia rettgeri]MDG4698927.1 replication initiation protein [Providencia sp. CRE-3FA-0001]MDX7324552.1 replication initiation protein [Providencia rettgeri]OBY34082.1 hypothetical protein PR729_06350 [Providencia rettgeri]